MTSCGQPALDYEYVVVGCGGLGSATLYWLTRSTTPGQRVLGLEQYHLGHDRGGSQDHSRIIRRAYDNDDCTKLTPHAYTAWSEVERESGVQLLYRTGSLHLAEVNTRGAHYTETFAASMRRHNVPFEELTGDQLRAKFPQFRGPDVGGLMALYQADGGLVDAARANAVHVRLARARGATVLEHCTATGIDTNTDDTATVHTTCGDFRCRRVVVTCGAWSARILRSVGLDIPLMVTQEQVTYYDTPHSDQFTKDNFPVFMFRGHHNVYGLPVHGNAYPKMGVNAGDHEVTADTRTFDPDEGRVKICEKFMKKYLPDFAGPINHTKTCLYTLTYDGGFILDTMTSRGKPQIAFCIGAGHAFKFSSLFGRILSQLATEGRTSFPISAFSKDRPALYDRDLKPTFVYLRNKGRPPPKPRVPTHKL